MADRLPPDKHDSRPELDRERLELLRRVERVLETPMLLPGFVWLGLMMLELTRGIGPGCCVSRACCVVDGDGPDAHGLGLLSAHR